MTQQQQALVAPVSAKHIAYWYQYSAHCLESLISEVQAEAGGASLQPTSAFCNKMLDECRKLLHQVGVDAYTTLLADDADFPTFSIDAAQIPIDAYEAFLDRCTLQLLDLLDERLARAEASIEAFSRIAEKVLKRGFPRKNKPRGFAPGSNRTCDCRRVDHCQLLKTSAGDEKNQAKPPATCHAFSTIAATVEEAKTYWVKLRKSALAIVPKQSKLASSARLSDPDPQLVQLVIRLIELELYSQRLDEFTEKFQRLRTVLENGA